MKRRRQEPNTPSPLLSHLPKLVSRFLPRSALQRLACASAACLAVAQEAAAEICRDLTRSGSRHHFRIAVARDVAGEDRPRIQRMEAAQLAAKGLGAPGLPSDDDGTVSARVGGYRYS